jgi:REP element-mobilizing transposase RayT
MLDSYVIMPHHLHLIVAISNGSAPQLGYARERGTQDKRSVSAFVNGFKAAVTSALKRLGLASDGTVWQRSFFDHIIRSEAGLFAIREYIANNARQWELDKLHPESKLASTDAFDELRTCDDRASL